MAANNQSNQSFGMQEEEYDWLKHQPPALLLMFTYTRACGKNSTPAWPDFCLTGRKAYSTLPRWLRMPSDRLQQLASVPFGRPSRPCP
jgi:hypothetical protein